MPFADGGRLARALGREDVDVYSAGSRPSGVVNARAIAFMRERGIDIENQRSKGLDEFPEVEWDAIVTMGCGDACPTLTRAASFDWDLPDPKHLDEDGFRAVRDDIERRVLHLINKPR